MLLYALLPATRKNNLHHCTGLCVSYYSVWLFTSWHISCVAHSTKHANENTNRRKQKDHVPLRTFLFYFLLINKTNSVANTANPIKYLTTILLLWHRPHLHTIPVVRIAALQTIIVCDTTAAYGFQRMIYGSRLCSRLLLRIDHKNIFRTEQQSIPCPLE